MKNKYEKKGTWESIDQATIDTAIDELATATMKYTLLSSGPRHKVCKCLAQLARCLLRRPAFVHETNDDL
jgi:hypothetical protein